MGHSAATHLLFARSGPDLLRKRSWPTRRRTRATLDPTYKPGPSPLAGMIAASAEVIAKGRHRWRPAIFMDALEGPGAWKRLPATPKQLLRDNATTLIGQMRDQPCHSQSRCGPDADIVHRRRQHQRHAAEGAECVAAM
jgi:hypothetical protein